MRFVFRVLPIIGLFFGALPASGEIKYDELSGLERYEQNLNRDRLDCSDVEVGKRRRVFGDSPFDSVAAQRQRFNLMNYELKRPTVNTYRIEFPVVFKPGADYDGEMPPGLDEAGRKRFVDQKYRTEINKCLERMNASVPKVNGFKVEFALHATSDMAVKGSAGGMVSTIEIGSRTRRADAGYYASENPCSTYLHELLHRAGLPDLYREPTQERGVLKDRLGKPVSAFGEVETPKFDCRPWAPEQNIMANSQLWEPGTHPGRLKTACFCQKNSCVLPPELGGVANGVLQMPNATNYKCPSGYERGSEASSSLLSQDQIKKLINEGTKAVFIFEDAKAPPMLTQGQLRHLIYPGCQEKNRRIYSCSSGAYDTSVEQGCGKLSTECSKDPKWMD